MLKEVVMTLTLDELEMKVQLLEDLEEIKNLHKEYVFCLACRQWDDLLDCFMEDATAEIGDYGLRRGKKEIRELVDNVLDKLPKSNGHIVGKPAITVKGDRATSYWNLYIFPNGQSATWEYGRYDCEYVKTDGKWKFISVKYTSPQPVQP
jgi:ketosteroid isomerase-like protein